MRVSLELPFALIFVVLPFVGVCYSLYRNGHLPLLAAAMVLGLLVAAALTWAERRGQRGG